MDEGCCVGVGFLYSDIAQGVFPTCLLEGALKLFCFFWRLTTEEVVFDCPMSASSRPQSTPSLGPNLARRARFTAGVRTASSRSLSPVDVSAVSEGRGRGEASASHAVAPPFMVNHIAAGPKFESAASSVCSSVTVSSMPSPASGAPDATGGGSVGISSGANASAPFLSLPPLPPGGPAFVSQAPPLTEGGPPPAALSTSSSATSRRPIAYARFVAPPTPGTSRSGPATSNFLANNQALSKGDSEALLPLPRAAASDLEGGGGGAASGDGFWTRPPLGSAAARVPSSLSTPRAEWPDVPEAVGGKEDVIGELSNEAESTPRYLNRAGSGKGSEILEGNSAAAPLSAIFSNANAKTTGSGVDDFFSRPVAPLKYTRVSVPAGTGGAAPDAFFGDAAADAARARAGASAAIPRAPVLVPRVDEASTFFPAPQRSQPKAAVPVHVSHVPPKGGGGTASFFDSSATARQSAGLFALPQLSPRDEPVLTSAAVDFFGVSNPPPPRPRDFSSAGAREQRRVAAVFGFGGIIATSRGTQVSLSLVSESVSVRGLIAQAAAAAAESRNFLVAQALTNLAAQERSLSAMPPDESADALIAKLLSRLVAHVQPEPLCAPTNAVHFSLGSGSEPIPSHMPSDESSPSILSSAASQERPAVSVTALAAAPWEQSTTSATAAAPAPWEHTSTGAAVQAAAPWEHSSTGAAPVPAPPSREQTTAVKTSSVAPWEQTSLASTASKSAPWEQPAITAPAQKSASWENSVAIPTAPKAAPWEQPSSVAANAALKADPWGKTATFVTAAPWEQPTPTAPAAAHSEQSAPAPQLSRAAAWDNASSANKSKSEPAAATVRPPPWEQSSETQRNHQPKTHAAFAAAATNLADPWAPPSDPWKPATSVIPAASTKEEAEVAPSETPHVSESANSSTQARKPWEDTSSAIPAAPGSFSSNPPTANLTASGAQPSNRPVVAPPGGAAPVVGSAASGSLFSSLIGIFGPRRDPRAAHLGSSSSGPGAPVYDEKLGRYVFPDDNVDSMASAGAGPPPMSSNAGALESSSNAGLSLAPAPATAGPTALPAAGGAPPSWAPPVYGGALGRRKGASGAPSSIRTGSAPANFAVFAAPVTMEVPTPLVEPPQEAEASLQGVRAAPADPFSGDPYVEQSSEPTSDSQAAEAPIAPPQMLVPRLGSTDSRDDSFL